MTLQGRIHEEFPVWYAEVSIGDDTSIREARWNGIVSLVNEIDHAKIEALLKLISGGRCQPSEQELAALYRPFADMDPTFTTRGNTRELQILAGTALVALMDQPDMAMGDVAALGVTTASVSGNRTLYLPFDLGEAAEHAIKRRGEKNRTRQNIVETEEQLSMAVNLAKAEEILRSRGIDPDSVLEAIGKVMNSVEYRLSKIVSEHARALKAINHFVRVQDEELEMLWWLVGEYSKGYDRPFGDIGRYEKPLVIALDLADMTNVLPGPAAIRAMLSRAGLGKGDQIKLCDIVNAVDGQWARNRCSMADVSVVATPIHEALRRRLETGRSEAWIAGWAAVTELPGDVEMSSFDVGLQFYRETLYLKR